MKVAEANINYKASMDITARDLFDALPLEVLLALSDYEEDEIIEMSTKLILASKMDKDETLHAGESMVVGGDVIIQE